MATAEPVIRVEGLFAGYVPDADILSGITLSVAQGEIVTVIGPNGAGKSTLVKAICGVLRPHSGAIYLGQRRIDGLPPHTITTRDMTTITRMTTITSTGMTTSTGIITTPLGMATRMA